jgi:hypothetical protein
MLDEVAMQEEQELESLINSFGEYQNLHQNNTSVLPRTKDYLPPQALSINSNIPITLLPQQHSATETTYGSDDDEYDDIFMDVIQQDNRIPSLEQLPSYLNDHEMMDMS